LSRKLNFTAANGNLSIWRTNITMNIPNLCGLDQPSPNLEFLRTMDPVLWDTLRVGGYQVTLPDHLGRSGVDPDGRVDDAKDPLAWYIEVQSDKAIAYLYHLEDCVYLGPKYSIRGTPERTVAEAKRLLEMTVQNETVSGVFERHAEPEEVDVYL
jgi:hypothetical protein